MLRRAQSTWRHRLKSEDEAAVIKLHRRIFSRRVSRYQARCRAHGKSIITHQASFPPAEWGTNNIMLAPNEKSSPDVSLPKKPETGDWHSYYSTFSTSYFPPHTFPWVYARTNRESRLESIFAHKNCSLHRASSRRLDSRCHDDMSVKSESFKILSAFKCQIMRLREQRAWSLSPRRKRTICDLIFRMKTCLGKAEATLEVMALEACGAVWSVAESIARDALMTAVKMFYGNSAGLTMSSDEAYRARRKGHKSLFDDRIMYEVKQRLQKKA